MKKKNVKFMLSSTLCIVVTETCSLISVDIFSLRLKVLISSAQIFDLSFDEVVSRMQRDFGVS